MKIIIYNPNTDEWSKFINSLTCDYKERDRLIDNHIVEIGKEISAKDFVNNSHTYTSWGSKLRFRFIGEPTDPLEKLVKYVYDGDNYIYMKDHFPEDFVESRTDWDDMVDYADDMSRFIRNLMEDMAYNN